MIGGTNQINLSLLLAGTFHAVSSRYYYVFQSNTKLLHPENDKPDMRNPPYSYVRTILQKWYELPVFQLAIGGLINELNEKLQPVMHVKELERLLQEHGLGKQYIAKIRGRLITLSGERVSSGPMLERIVELNKRINKGIDNFTKWKKWGTERQILWELVEGTLVKVE
jgi:hypothetical protein